MENRIEVTKYKDYADVNIIISLKEWEDLREFLKHNIYFDFQKTRVPDKNKTFKITNPKHLDNKQTIKKKRSK